MSTSIAEPLQLFPRRRQRVKFAAARPRLRLAIRRALNTGRVTGAEADALAEALDDDDLLEEAYYRSRVEFAEEPPAGRDWAGFFGALAKFVEALAPIVMALLKLFVAAAPTVALAAPSTPGRRAMQRRFNEHPDGPELHAMALALPGLFRESGFDFTSSSFQSAWRLFSNAVNSTLQAFDATAIGDVLAAMHALEESLASYDGYADLPHVLASIASFLQAIFDLLGAK